MVSRYGYTLLIFIECIESWRQLCCKPTEPLSSGESIWPPDPLNAISWKILVEMKRNGFKCRLISRIDVSRTMYFLAIMDNLGRLKVIFPGNQLTGNLV